MRWLDSVTGKVGLAVCAGLLLASLVPVSEAESVRIAHCLGGCPGGATEDNHLIARSVYSLSFNSQTRIADWVAYIVTADSIGVATNLSRAPEADPFEPDVLDPADFIENGEGNQDRLLLDYFAPLVSFAGTPFWSETNFLTNRVPRNSELNRGSWYGLEWAVRNLANQLPALYVLTGPVYGSDTDRSGAAPLPDGFFKVIADETGRVAAFLFPQQLPFHIHHCDQLTTLDEVERVSGLELFPELAGMPRGDLSERLGCFR